MRRNPKLWLPAALALVVGMTAVASGCARAARLASQNDRTFCARSTATVYVQNDNWLDVVVYVVRGGARFRLGQVTSVQSAVFEVPSAALGATSDLYLLADPIGSNYPYATDQIMIAPGHTIIELRVDNIISHSSYSVGVEDPQDI
ncbi:MAG: hypothetical protein HY560_04170 [Gemmatimonadetes bacterium]|nr:hypothetical protein [Gemmatimonadota bacterium]